jgi:hypothetical protein
MMDIQKAATRIGDIAREKRISLLVGSGPSTEAPASYPTWADLMRRATAVVREYHDAYASAMAAEIEEQAYIDAADYFSRRDVVPRSRRVEFFRSEFAKRPPSLPDIYKLLVKLPVHNFATTNYDPCLELACAEIAGPLDNDDASGKAFLDGFASTRQLIYLHGRATKYDTIIFDRSSFNGRLQSSIYVECLKRIYTTTSVVAIGYSGNDPDLALIANYIGNALGGAGSSEHFILLDKPPREELLSTLRKANWNIVLYPEGQHEQVKVFLRTLVGKLKAATAPLTYLQRSASSSLRTLAIAFLRNSHPTDTSFGSACEAIVLRALREDSLKPNQIWQRAASLLAIPADDAATMLKPAVATLISRGRVVKDSNGALKCASPTATDSIPESSRLEKAVISRAQTYLATFADTSDVRSGIRRIVAEVMFTEGMALARSFFWRDDAAAYDLPAILTEAIASTPQIPKAFQNALRDALYEVVVTPDPEISQELHRLATAAYLMERIMLHPKESQLGEAMQWRMYFDSNVLMRFLSPFDKRTAPIKRLVQRLRQLQIPLYVLFPFISEIAQNSSHVERTVRGIKRIYDLRKLVESQSEGERSPILTWYYGQVQQNGKCIDYREFAQKEGLNSAAALERRLRKLEFIVEGYEANRQMDTSERETLWDHLRRTQRRDNYSAPARHLRRNEATQVEWLVELRRKGTRAWFVSIDSELRRSLQLTDFAKDRDYSGYVLSPAAWAMRLNELQWAAVGIDGFVEMMWSLPERTDAQKVTDSVLIRLTEELSSQQVQIEPEVLRDEVEKRIVSKSTAVAAIAASDDTEAAINQLVDEIVVPTASELLEKYRQLQRSPKPRT